MPANDGPKYLTLLSTQILCSAPSQESQQLLSRVWREAAKSLSHSVHRDFVLRPFLETKSLVRTCKRGREKSPLPESCPSLPLPDSLPSSTSSHSSLSAENAFTPIVAIKLVLANPSHPLIFWFPPLGPVNLPLWCCVMNHRLWLSICALSENPSQRQQGVCRLSLSLVSTLPAVSLLRWCSRLLLG